MAAALETMSKAITLAEASMQPAQDGRQIMDHAGQNTHLEQVSMSCFQFDTSDCT